jgi:hypothetical protein
MSKLEYIQNITDKLHNGNWADGIKLLNEVPMIMTPTEFERIVDGKLDGFEIKDLLIASFYIIGENRWLLK